MKIPEKKGGDGMKKRLWAIFLAAVMLLTAAGCGAEPVEEEEPDPAPVEEPEPYVPAGTNPLTGMPMEPVYEKNRPVAVMLNNLKAAQPQLGVSQADIIYEVPAEGGITRMLGVFQTLEGVGDLGSIRSARPYYLELALGHDALFVHAGGSPEAYRDISAWDVDNMDGVNGGSDAKIFWRDAERRKNARYEHSLLTSGENILAYLDQGHFRTEHEEGYETAQLFTEDGTPSDGVPAAHVTLRFSQYKTGQFDYDAESGRYLVSQYGAAYTDGNTGEQVGVTNLLVLETSIYVISGDTAGRLSVKLTGSGEGTYFCGGKAVPITWSKAERNSPLVYHRADGTPLALGKGTSYVCIMSPRTSTLSYTE